MSSFHKFLKRFLCEQSLYSLVEDNRSTVLDSASIIIYHQTFSVKVFQNKRIK
uniref:Uncharacterized protein n=1 Tax=Siphoviridae sp. ctnOB2 TaxID=2825661 RepID=A0A8S5PE67_9CAUD|nr:MAG TPA: hypothetical protein [Siphoviridae sp. ctnOB2]DAQ05862.1 MAG TPA: hypothetical protein [Caudoviricetes sp.]